jgi:SAM-dependent methyltransferase
MSLQDYNEKYFQDSYDSWGKFWSRIGARPDFQDKKVLDFGCGHGAFTIRAAECGAEAVGLDLDQKRTEYAQFNLKTNFSHLEPSVKFVTQRVEEYQGRFSFILTNETLEHIIDLPGMLNTLHLLLEPHGLLYAGWGGLWPSPFGGHALMKEVRGVGIPFSHLFVKRALSRYKAKYPNRRSSSIQDVEMNGLGIRDYERIIKESPFEIISWRTNVGSHPVNSAFKLCSKLSRTYFTHNVYAVLKATESR